MISFSGIDCGGKSTQIDIIVEYMKAHGIRYKKIWSRGGYTPILEMLKTLIRTDRSSDGHSEAAEAYRQSVHSNKKKRKLLLWLSIFDLGLYYGVHFRFVELFGTTILADRYFWDSYIDFQMKYPEIEFEKWLVWKFARSIYKKPKYSLIYTIPAELSMQRSALKDEPWPESVEIRKQRIERYMNEIAKGRWRYVIDATQSIDNVAMQTKRILHYED